MRAAIVTAGLIAGLALAGCGLNDGFAVAVTVTGDSSLSSWQLASIVQLEFQVSGAETSSATYPLLHPFRSHREERVLYRPLTRLGELMFQVSGRDANSEQLAFGETTIGIRPGITVPATVILRLSVVQEDPDQGPISPPDGGTPGLCSLASDEGKPCALGVDSCHDSSTCVSGVCTPHLKADGAVCQPSSDPCKNPGTCTAGACSAITDKADGAVCQAAPDACHIDATCTAGVCGAVGVRPDGYNYAPGALNHCCSGVPSQVNTATHCGVCGIKCATGKSCVALNGEYFCQCSSNSQCFKNCCSTTGGTQAVCVPSTCVAPVMCTTCPTNGTCTEGSPHFYCHY